MKYKIIEDERYPTLYLDENDLGWYLDEECEEIPDILVENLKEANEKLLLAERSVREFLKRK